MKRIHSSLNTIELSMLKDHLDREDFECIIQQENLSQLAGIMSPGHCMAELWILNDEDEEKALKVLESVKTNTEKE